MASSSGLSPNPDPSSENTTFPGQVPEPEPQHVVGADRPGHQTVELARLGPTQMVPEGTAVQDGLDGRLGHQQRLGSSFGHAPVRGPRPGS